MIVDGQDVSGLDAAVQETLAVKVRESLQERLEHVACFRGDQSPLWEEFRQIFCGELHDHVEQIHTCQLAAPSFKELDQIWMRKLRSLLPARDLEFGVPGIRRHELDRGLLRFAFAALGQEYDAVIRAAQMFEQLKFAVNDLTFALFPSIGHCAPPSSATK